MSTTYSQLGQDLEVVKQTRGQRGGYFVDVGAHDGQSFSNTYLLETEFGWKGVCVEPIAAQFEKCKACRPASTCYNMACYSSAGVTEFSVSDSFDMLSGIVSHLSGGAHEKAALNGRRIQVPTETLTALLDRSDSPAVIDYLSLDTEGSELEILKSPGLFEKYQFKIVHVEHNFLEPGRSEIREWLKKRGYVFLHQNKWDDVYVCAAFQHELLL